MITFKKYIEEGSGLWANIHKKRKEGRPMRKPGSKGAPTKADFKSAQEEIGDNQGPVVKAKLKAKK